MKASFSKYWFLPALISAILQLNWYSSAVLASGSVEESFGGRSMIVYVPSALPAKGTRALVVVLHGGMGNAQRVASAQTESGLNMNRVAEKNGFIVAYLNGTPVTRRFGADKLGWNAGGGCCGVPAETNIDDVGYIQGAVDRLAKEYGINRSKIFGMGHSNGAMMTARLMCETNLFAAGVCISGPLNLRTDNCPAASGKRILAIHGTEDENVPIAGGRGTKGLSNAVYNSEAVSKQVFTKSGASYQLQLVDGADHTLSNIDAAVQQKTGQTIADEAAAFFGLVARNR